MIDLHVASTFLDDDPLANLDVGAGQAVIEALAVAVYADADTNVEEETELHAILTNLSWSWSHQLVADEYIPKAMRLAKSVSSDQSRLYFLAEHIAERIDPGAYEHLFRLLIRITTADGDINRQEKLMLGAFSYAFRIPEPRALTLFDQALRRLRKQRLSRARGGAAERT